MTRLLLADAAWFFAATLIALGMGMVGDRFFRHPPLGWHYQTAAQRVLATPGSGSKRSINMVSLDEVIALVSRPDVIALDARPRVFYELGHLPGARSLSREQFAVDFALLENELRGHTLLVYCSDAGCEDSAIVAHELQKRGLGPLILFPGGLEEWEAAAHPVETVP